MYPPKRILLSTITCTATNKIKRKIILITSIPQEVFMKSGATVKSSLVFLKKFNEDETEQWNKNTTTATKIVKAKYKKELESNCTIKLGYTNLRITKCQCNNKETFISGYCEGNCENVYISLVDCPGHNCLLSTMLSGASIMNSVIMIISGNEKVDRRLHPKIIFRHYLSLQSLILQLLLLLFVLFY